MSTDTKKGVPGIPLAALDAIQDQNVRDVLRAVVDGWHVRNGSSGDGQSRFVTAAELGDLSGQVGGLKKTVSTVEQKQANPTLSPSQISRVITDLQASVMESVLFKELGDRIKLIDITATGVATGLATEITNRTNADNAIVQSTTTQFATVNGNISALQTQQTTTSNNVAALSSSVSTLQVQVGSNTSAIQTEATTRANADNDIYAKYSVKIDQNGYVSGYGLMSTANNSTPQSDFIVRADRFAIGSPSGPGITPRIPFIVRTTTTTLPNGTTVAPGVYMDYAVVDRLYGTYIDAGYLRAANIYTGSQYVDWNSKQQVPAVGGGNYIVALYTGTTPTTGSGLRFYGPNYHSSAPYYQRIRNTTGQQQIGFIVSASATVDHFFTIWYRMNGGTWSALTTITEPQTDYGSASICVGTSLSIGSSDYVDFGMSCTDASGNPLSGSKIDIRQATMSVICFNL